MSQKETSTDRQVYIEFESPYWKLVQGRLYTKGLGLANTHTNLLLCMAGNGKSIVGIGVARNFDGGGTKYKSIEFFTRKKIF